MELISITLDGTLRVAAVKLKVFHVLEEEHVATISAESVLAEQQTRRGWSLTRCGR